MKTTYKVIEIDCLNPFDINTTYYILVCSHKGKGNTYIRMTKEELRDFYFSDYKFKKLQYMATPWWYHIYNLPFNEAISVEEQIIFS